jgi:hypothetical protein
MPGVSFAADIKPLFRAIDISHMEPKVAASLVAFEDKGAHH